MLWGKYTHIFEKVNKTKKSLFLAFPPELPTFELPN
jgi:hypothetical protein